MNLRELYQEIGSDYKIVLARFCNEENLLRRFVCSFPEDPTYQNLAAAAASSDYPEVEIHAHTLKGVSGNLGFDRLQNACADVVACIRQNRTDAVPDHYSKLKEEYELIINKINMVK